MIWLDFSMFLMLAVLFLYVFSSSTVTVLHRIYLLLHVVFIMWPLFQFASQTTSETSYRLLYLSASYLGLSLLGIGWFVFILFLTGQSYVIRKSRLFVLSIPALISVTVVCWNPNGMFLTINDKLEPLKQLQHGPLFWIMIGQLLLYLSVSLVILIYKMRRKDESARQRKMVRTALIGLFMLAFFAFADLFVNIYFIAHFARYIPLISVGLASTATYIVNAISRNRVFDIIQIVQRDVVNTMSTGILVMDENDIILEVNKVMKPILRLRIGDFFQPAALAAQFKDDTAKQLLALFEAQRSRPMERLEVELNMEINPIRHAVVQSAPILDGKKRIIGRVLTFQDVTELRMLVEETNTQNELLQQRNSELLLMQDELYQANKKLEHMAITDGLTGCYNRRYLLQQLEAEIVANIRYGIPFSLFIFDLDHFKTINDRFGHLTGDEVLCSTVDAVRSVLRLTDVLSRFGGEEFTVYLPHTNKEQAELIAEQVKMTVEQNKVPSGVGEGTISVTISMGVISIDRFDISNLNDPKSYLRELMAQADAALYEAKYNGRNRIVKSKLA
ncbi:diguanylate cyclase [Paenibacillus sp. LHD-117]|uniref:histidine kinase N-terminal 7TM domain-containing diguanylate cyclase n=1 Tax=Paenibacillus sp. LHD-117 TaxID=3071412 RepID=UPI0027DFB769|nr:diguanylate cyclase [Paenibacillus sp. LHD-117]MDQ6420087.1 diguanylate cyclase [Paenibacillus sp. LHD-117]